MCFLKKPKRSPADWYCISKNRPDSRWHKMLQKRNAPCPIGFPTAQNQTIKSWDCEAEVVSLLPSSKLSLCLAWSHLPSPPFFSNILTFYFQKKTRKSQKKHLSPGVFFRSTLKLHRIPVEPPSHGPRPETLRSALGISFSIPTLEAKMPFSKASRSSFLNLAWPWMCGGTGD